MDSRVVVSMMAVLAIVQFFAQPGYAITCVEVDVALLPCIGYLRGSSADPTLACCNGVKAVKGMGQTPEDKRTCCNCVKAAANRYPDLKDAAALSLPAKCGVQLDIPISRSVDMRAKKRSLSGIRFTHLHIIPIKDTFKDIYSIDETESNQNTTSS